MIAYFGLAVKPRVKEVSPTQSALLRQLSQLAKRVFFNAQIAYLLGNSLTAFLSLKQNVLLNYLTERIS